MLIAGAAALAAGTGAVMLVVRERAARAARIRQLEEVVALQIGQNRSLAAQMARLEGLLVDKGLLDAGELEGGGQQKPEPSGSRDLH